ncbi:MAG: AmmeMemoRadiSam system protein A [Candidatus Aegiribacteria sp.]|nr:AmmeMemoRadiSam system protein A [Candidatus Aegiribacteria sp.]
MTSEKAREDILDLARSAVAAAASGEALPEVPDEEVFRRDGGAFVTLKKGGTLRGCIGHFIGTGSLGKTVVEMAASAAVRDPRFSPVKPDEVDDLEIDISLLSPMIPAVPEDVVPGTHGLYIKYGFRSGTLLPQVATETGWDRETFLSHTCLKAGLPPDSWKRDGVQIFTYTAEVFGEKEKGANSV